jgi:hypothetical protein
VGEVADYGMKAVRRELNFPSALVQNDKALAFESENGTEKQLALVLIEHQRVRRKAGSGPGAAPVRMSCAKITLRRYQLHGVLAEGSFGAG